MEASYGPAVDGADPTEVFIVELDGEPAGSSSATGMDDYPAWQAPWRPSGRSSHAAAGIDYLIGVPALTGVGLGPLVIARFTVDTFARYPDVDTVVVAVHQANHRSWRALEKAGFTRVFAGMIESDDPSDDGPSFVYVRRR